MKKTFSTIQEAEAFIQEANILLGYPDQKTGTETYSIPEPVIDETGEITGYDVPLTDELNILLYGETTEDITE